MESPQFQLVCRESPRIVVHLDEVVGRARRRRRSVQIAGQHASQVEIDGAEIEVDEGRRLSGEHLLPIERHDALPGPLEHKSGVLVHGHVVGVGPNAELRIVVQAAERVLVPVVLTQRVGRRGHRDALVEGPEEQPEEAVGNRELAEQPAIGQVIVEHDDVAVVCRLAWSPESRPERIAGGRAVEQRRRRRGRALREDRKRQVHPLHVVAAAHGANRVRRQHTVHVAHAFEGHRRTRDGGDARIVLSDRVEKKAARAPDASNRFRLPLIGALFNDGDTRGNAAQRRQSVEPIRRHARRGHRPSAPWRWRLPSLRVHDGRQKKRGADRSDKLFGHAVAAAQSACHETPSPPAGASQRCCRASRYAPTKT